MSGAGKKKWGLWLLRVLGIALLGWVIWQVDWRDSITLADDTEVRGSIEGVLPPDWTPQSRLSFTPVDGPTREYSLSELASERVGEVDVYGVREGLIRIVRLCDGWLLALGMVLFGLTSHFAVWRWWLLLRAQGIRMSFWVCHKLTFVGMFFNNVVPGATGGDVIKAVYVSRRTDKRAAAVVTVMVDRITGIIALAMISAAALLTQIGNPTYTYPAILIFGFLGCVTAGALLFFSRTLRRWFRVDSLVARLPGGGVLRKADEAMLLYRHQKKAVIWAFVLSFANQLSIQIIMILFAAGLHVTTRAGEAVPVTDYLVVLPVGFMVAAVPLFPGGWGVREGAFAFFFHQVGVGRNPAVALSVLGGVMMLLWSLLGGIYVVLGRSSGDQVTGNIDEDASPQG